MELRQLRSFIKVAETLSFSEAARELCVTQSTLSQQIKQLEQEFGTMLFDRDSHSVSLTEPGRELLPCARDTVSSADTCRDRMQDLRRMLTGSLDIGVTYSFSPILTETIFAFMKQYPGVRLNVCYKPMAELMELLRQRRVDCVLAYRPSEPMPGIESHTLFQNCLAAVVNDRHPLARLRRVTPAELSRYSLALPTAGLQARNAFDRVLERCPCDLRIHVELNDPHILLDLVRHSTLATVLAEASVYKVTDLRAVPLDVPDNEMTGGVHTLADSYHKRSMKEFVRMLGESLAVRERAISWL